MLSEIKSCEVCGSNSLRSVLDLGMHPMCDDLVAVGDDRICKDYPIEILFCDTCITGHQRFQIPKHELFPANYHYRSRHTADVLAGMQELVVACNDLAGGISGKKVLDVGCNDGSLLSFFRDKGAATFGIEPTGACKDAAASGHAVTNEFFSRTSAASFVAAHGKPDIITFTNVFAHIEDLDDVIAALNILKHENTVIVIENHYLGAVLDRFQFDTFYHEHPRTYSYTSFVHIAKKLGMRIAHVEFPPRYNGNIRIVYMPGSDNHAGWEELHPKETAYGAGLVDMAAKLGLWKKNKRAVLAEQVRLHGKLCAKAFPGRAAIPVKLLGLDVDMISAAYEKPGSAKIGHYIPGTRIPVLSDDKFDLGEETVPLLNLAWHIAREITSYMRGRGYKGPIIDIIAADDIG